MHTKTAFVVIVFGCVPRICAQVPYVKLADGATGCANGTDIVSQALCQGAIASLGLNYSTNSWTNQLDVPRFCSHGDSFITDIHWSNSSTGTGNVDLGPVCRETPIRYIKLQSILAENWAAWREIEVFASDQDGVLQNVALFGTATASSYCDHDQCGPYEHLPVHAIDGDESTSWNSGGAAPAWIEIDLGNAFYIDRVRAVFGPQPFCMAVIEEGQDSNGAGCEAYGDTDVAVTQCVNASVFANNLFDAAEHCCVCGGGDTARVGVDGTIEFPAHTLLMAGPGGEFAEFKAWISKPSDSEEVEYLAVLSSRPRGLFTCAPLENEVDYVGNSIDRHDRHGGPVRSAEACCALCQREYAAGCRFWSWDGDDRCQLKTSDAGRTASVGRISGAVAQVMSDALDFQAQCEGEIQLNVDIEGFDLGGHVRAESSDRCCALCRAAYSNGCRFWTFHDDHCHLKSSNVSTRAREGRTSGSIGMVAHSQEFACANTEEGIEFHGDDLDLPGGPIKVASAEECCDQCQGAYAQGCRFWTYKIPDGHCNRKTGQGERQEHSLRISGSVGQVIQQEMLATCGEMEEGVEFHGGGADMAGGHVSVDSAEDCCELCRTAHLEGCRFWTYHTNNGNCHRKTSIGDGRRQREDRISGAIEVVDANGNSSTNLAGFTDATISGVESASLSAFVIAAIACRFA